MTVECHTSFSDPGATANDACAGSVSVNPSGSVNVNTPGSYTITWNAIFKWVGGSAPTLSTAVGKADLLRFESDGTNLYDAGRSLDVR